MSRFTTTELAEEIGISERDVIDVAHDAGCEEFYVDGLEVEYDDFDRISPMFSARGYCPRWNCLISADEAELVLDGPVAEKFSYLTGMAIYK
jgi:hypothetical protein